MPRPRVSTIIIIGQSVLLLICLGFLGFFMLMEHFSVDTGKDYAYQAGSAEAMRHYLRHQYSLYEMQLYGYADDTGPIPYDGMTRPAGKMENHFQVDYFLVAKDTPRFYREIEQNFIDGYNGQMRAYFEHPEMFDVNGLRIPMRELNSHTNKLDSFD